jgi:hypothetical protein
MDGANLTVWVCLETYVFRDDNDGDGSAVIDFVCGLGLNLQRSRLKQQQRREETPKVLPPIFNQQKMLCPTNTAISQKMLARDGTELNFHAVQLMTDDVGESTPAVINDVDNSAKNLDKDKCIQITIAPWIPTHLLCKRWGVPFPSTEGISNQCLSG